MSSSLDLINSNFLEGSADDTGNVVTQEEEELTADEVLQRLQDAWINEKFSPELLEPQAEIVDCLMEQLTRTEEHISTLEKGHFGIAIHKMELQRIRFLISAYLRLRLEKIQAHVFHLVNQISSQDVEEFDHMTQEEAEFARNYKESLDSLFKEVALSKLPARVAEFNSISGSGGLTRPDPPLPQPNLQAAVFVQAIENIRGITVEDEAFLGRDEDLDLEKDSQHILRYSSIRKHLRKGLVKLI